MKYVDLDADGLPNDVAEQLFQAWIIFGCAQHGMAQYGSSAGAGGRILRFGSPTESHFELLQTGRRYTLAKSGGIEDATIFEIVRMAARLTKEHDFGAGVVHKTEMSIQPLDIADGLHFLRVLGDQVHIEGRRRLSDAALLNFEEGLLNADESALFAPNSRIEMTLFTPGPCQSDLTQRLAAAFTEIAAAICALACGRPVDFRAPRYSLDEVEAKKASRSRRDPAILELARDSVSLDIFGDLPARGGPDALLRARGAILGYHAAIRQSVPDVAVMLFVSSIEALISPHPNWGKSKVTQRFVKSLIELCPQAVDDLLDHDNVEEAFVFRKRGGRPAQRRALLERIYESRSISTHAGIGVSPGGFYFAGGADSMRVALLSELTKSAILGYLQAPRSSVIGHPSFEPVVPQS